MKTGIVVLCLMFTLVALSTAVSEEVSALEYVKELIRNGLPDYARCVLVDVEDIPPVEGVRILAMLGEFEEAKKLIQYHEARLSK